MMMMMMNDVDVYSKGEDLVEWYFPICSLEWKSEELRERKDSQIETNLYLNEPR